MPIRPENKARYPTEWPEIRERILRRAGNSCEWCGVENHSLGGRTSSGTFLKAVPLGNGGRGPSGLEWPMEGTWASCGRAEDRENLRIIRIVLTVAHVHDHSPENCAEENLAALCQRCHNRHDAPARLAGRIARWREKLGIVDMFTPGGAVKRSGTSR